MIEWGQGEYLAERKEPLSDWFKGQNLAAKIRVEVASAGDLFGTGNAMLAIRHLRKRTVIHVPLAQALAAGLPGYLTPRELRTRQEHSHGCFKCGRPMPCVDLDCYGDNDPFCLCMDCQAHEAVEMAEQALAEEQFRQPQLWENPDDITRKIAALKAAVTRARKKVEVVKR